MELPIEKSNNVSKKPLFIRHGSTTEIADPEEIMEIERERHETDPDGLENIALEISDLRSSVSDLRWWLERFESYFDRDRSIEYTFAGILSGIYWVIWLSPLFLALFISIMIAIISSGLKFVGFGLLRSIEMAS